MFLIPASRAPLRRIFIGGHDILLAYANGKARVWNVETMEFRRSTGLDAAEDMIHNGRWMEMFVSPSSFQLMLTSITHSSDMATNESDLALSPVSSIVPESSDQGERTRPFCPEIRLTRP